MLPSFPRPSFPELLIVTGTLCLSSLPLSTHAEAPDPGARLAAIERDLSILPELLPSLQTHQRIGHHGYGEERSPEALPWIQIDLAEVRTPEKIVLFPARLPVPGEVLSVGFPGEFRIELSHDSSFTDAIEIAHWKEAFHGEGETLPFLSFSLDELHTGQASGRHLRIFASGLRRDPVELDRPYFRLGEIVVLENGQNVALKRPVLSSTALENPRRWEPMNLTDGYFWCRPLRGTPSSPTNGFRSGFQKRELPTEEAWVEVDLGTRQAIDEIHLVPAHPQELPDSFGFGFPPRFWILADAGTPQERELLREVDPPYPAEALPNPGAAQVTLALDGLVARTIRLRSETLARTGPVSGRGPTNYLFALSEMQVWRRGVNLAEGQPVRFANTQPGERWSPEALVDGFSSRHRLLSWNDWISQMERRRKLEEEASFLASLIDDRERQTVQRVLVASISAAILAILLAVIIVLALRNRAEISREALRARIARDLHDEIGASLSHLAMQSDLARRQLTVGELKPGRLKAISSTARDTLDHMRDIIWLLTPRPGSWDDLSYRLESIANRLLEGMEHEVEVEGSIPEGNPPLEWAREIVSFLKETLTNVRKHSRASSVRTRIQWSDSLVLEVSDDGVGFEAEQAQRKGGSGLDNLKTRAASLRARLEILSDTGQGTTIRLDAPLPSV